MTNGTEEQGTTLLEQQADDGTTGTADAPHGDPPQTQQPRLVPVAEVKEIATRQFTRLLEQDLSLRTGIALWALREQFEEALDERLTGRTTVPIHEGNEIVLVTVNPNALSTAALYVVIRENELGRDDDGLIEAIGDLQTGDDYEGRPLFCFIFDVNTGEDDGTDTDDRVAAIEENQRGRVGLALPEVALGLNAFESFRNAADNGWIAAIGSTIVNDEGTELTPEVGDKSGAFDWASDLSGDYMPTGVVTFPDEEDDEAADTP